jgi:Protein of unknown function (DUF4230)
MQRRKKFGFAVAIILILLIGIALFHRLYSGLSTRDLSSPAVLVQIQKLKQLVSVRYSIQRVVGMTEPKIPFGEESILLIVQGEAVAGVDLGKLGQRDVRFTGENRVTLRLPSAKLMDTYLDEKQIKVWDRHVTWWTPWVPFNPDLEHKARLQALDEIRKAALAMNILDQAQTNAESAIKQFLAALHLDATFEQQNI